MTLTIPAWIAWAAVVLLACVVAYRVVRGSGPDTYGCGGAVGCVLAVIVALVGAVAYLSVALWRAHHP